MLNNSTASCLLRRLALAGLVAAACTAAPPAAEVQKLAAPSAGVSSDYVLGPGDQLKIWALGVEEVSDRPIRIDAGGGLDFPLIGRVQAEGCTLEQLRGLLLKKLQSQVWKPQVSIEIVEFGSQPVTVLGAVTKPGLQQLQGRKSLAEILSMAGGLRPDAGNSVKITREKRFGAIPLPSARWDGSGEYSVAEVPVRGLLRADSPADNILMRPHDVVTVPAAEMVYVVGTVVKPGAFVLNERESISVLQALSLAEGLGRTAKPEGAKILRAQAGGSQRTELPVNLKRVLEGRAEDVGLKANDILFIPDSTPKRVAVRSLEAAVQAATGVAIWRR